MRVAFGCADRQAGRGRDVVERDVERVLQYDDGRLCDRQLGKTPAELAAGLRCGELAGGVGVEGDARVLEQRLGAALGGPPRLRDVLARVDRQAVQPRGELRLASKLPDALYELDERLLRGVARVLRITQDVECDSVHPAGVPLAERCKSELVSVFGSAHEDGVRKPLVDERSVGPQVTHRWTGSAGGRLHGGLYSRGLMWLTPGVVLPALRASYGREYHWAEQTATTQQLLPPNATHGAVALAERQSKGRGRLGRTWVDSGLMFSVALYPPQPVARWPELTLVAAHAVAGAIGPEATIKHPNDVLVGGRKAAGILAEAGERVVLGIGINVGSAAWPGAGWVDRNRLDLLVDVLARLERGYDDWLASTAR